MRFAKENIKNLKQYKLSTVKAWSFSNYSSTLKLDWNESTIKPSPAVYEKIKKVLESGRLNWYPNINNQELITEISKYSGVTKNEVQYFASSDSLHEYIVRAFVCPKDRILTVTPTYDNFRAVTEVNDANVMSYNLNNLFELNIDKFKSDLCLIIPKIVYIVNPNNPTGTLHDTAVIKDLIKSNKNILFIIDEAYFEFSNLTSASLVKDYDNIIVSRTFSKAFGLASFRIGYVIANSTIIDTLNKIRNPKNISLFAQEAAIAALQDVEYMKNYVKAVNKAKITFHKYLLTKPWIKSFKSSGNFLFLEIFMNKKDELIKYLEKHKVFIRDYGHISGTENFVRITIGESCQMEIVMHLIDEFELQFILNSVRK
jgi:histidinol-phosphate aminotransferase